MKFKIILLMMVLKLLGSCAASAPSDGENVCTKTCGSRYIGGGKLHVLPLGQDVSLKCAGATTLPTLSYRYFVYEDPSPGNQSSSSSSGSSSDKPVYDIPKRIPKPSIAFYPMTPGNLSLESEPSEWCTDSCGIAEVKFKPTSCAKQDVKIGIIVPGMQYEDDKVPTTGFSVAE